MKVAKLLKKVLVFGVLGYVCLFLPVLLAVIGYWLFRLFGLPIYTAKLFGTALLSLCPMLLIGQALARAREAKTKSKQISPTPAQTSGREDPPAQTVEGEPPGKEYEQIIDIWKTSLEVQQHFNDLELQIRNFAVTLLVAVLGATAFALKEHYAISIFGSTFSLAVAICLAGVPGLLGFYFMDRHWYHRLLIGSVKQAISIENRTGGPAFASFFLSSRHNRVPRPLRLWFSRRAGDQCRVPQAPPGFSYPSRDSGCPVLRGFCEGREINAVSSRFGFLRRAP